MTNKLFINPDPTKKPKGFMDVIKWRRTAKAAIWPNFVPINNHDIPPANNEHEEIRVSYVGHVTFLIQIKGLNILTDPVWSERASPFTWIGPKRVVAPGIKMEDLPKIDIILISHNHYDHMDIETIKILWHKYKPKIIAPLENEKTLKVAIKDIEVETLNWGDNTSFRDCKISLEAAQHWSARGIFDRNRALWGTFLIETKQGTICFIGDTGYCSKTFKEIGNKYNNILLSLIPIGAYEPRWFMEDVHVNPEEAVFIHQDLKSKFSIASHFNTFPLAEDHYDQAPKELAIALKKHNISAANFITPSAGQNYNF